MKRKQSRSPNSILYWSPPQFPACRRGNITQISTNKNNASEEETGTDADDDELEYLKHRFDESVDTGPSVPEERC